MLAGHAEDVDELMAASLPGGPMIEAARTELVTKVGENVSLRRFARVEADDFLGFYAHGARIGALVSLAGGNAELAKDIAMHVAASKPLCLDEAGVPAETLETERRIFTEQARESGKPAEIVDRMVTRPCRWASCSNRKAPRSANSSASRSARGSRRNRRTSPQR